MERKNALVTLIILAFAPLAGAQYGGGSGTADDPYLIYSPEQMNAIGADPNNWDKHFKLMADIDLSQYTDTDFNLIGEVTRRRSGTRDNAFTGIFDGNGHSIANFTWSSSTEGRIGLFRTVDDPNAEIHDVHLIAPIVEGLWSVGALVGYVQEGTVQNCSVRNGQVVGTGPNMGGLVGDNCGTVTNCSVQDVYVSGNDSVGGLVGYHERGDVSSCHATGRIEGGGGGIGGLVGYFGDGILKNSDANSTIIGDGGMGGLVGISHDGILTDCLATGSVTSNGSDVGGLVGINGGRITTCYAASNVAGTSHNMGGFAGSNNFKGTITSCYSMGAVTGRRCVGGFLGYNDWGGIVTNCYSTSYVTGEEDTGGFVGYVYGSDFIRCFWDVEASGQTASAAGGGRTTARMQTASTFTGWGSGIWTIDEGVDYPRLWWEDQPGIPIEGGDYPPQTGTADDPILIHTAKEMALIGSVPNNWDKHFKLMADIDLASFQGNSFAMIGYDENNAFTGVFDGNGHTISNFTYQSSDARYVGLFGCVSSDNALIRNLGLCNPRIDCSCECYVGAMVGYLAEGTLTHCCVQGGMITSLDSSMVLPETNDVPDRGTHTYSAFVLPDRGSSDSAGGLVGYNVSGAIVGCYSSATVIGDRYAGGLIGYHLSDALSDCYSIGFVSDGYRSGGLVGYARFAKTRQSFWDMETSEQAESYGGTGLTTAEMQDPNTFIAAGWDLFGPEDGINDVWTVDPDTGYPMLWWQVPENEQPESVQFSGGTGTAEDPYLIAYPEQLNGIACNPRFMNSRFQLIADIDLTGVGLSPIGNTQYPFAGVFDGDGWMIVDLTYTSEDKGPIGLFSCVRGNDAQIKNVTLVSPSVNAEQGDKVGALVGWLNKGMLTHCHVIDGSISGNDNIGGLVGYGRGRIGSCSADSVVTGNAAVGGLVGYGLYGIITNSSSDGSVVGSKDVGGLVGDTYCNLTIDSCSSAAVVNGKSYTGGLIGHVYFRCNIRNSRAVGLVFGESRTGGLAGLTWSPIRNCYAQGNVTGSKRTAGLVGRSYGDITNCYSVGSVIGDSDNCGLTGSDEEAEVSASFWDVEISGVADSDGGTGLTTAEMQTAATFLAAGWDFMGEIDNGTDEIWWIDEGADYPRLWWEASEEAGLAGF